MKFSNKILSQTVTQLCLKNEVNRIVISPGSRNAPLTIGFTEHPSFTNYSIVDERCAAFFALGIAQQTRKPVVLVCSSGSALLNYFPAIAEAYYSDISLIVISADRPSHLLEIGDGQTIQQENVFGKHILYNANCKEGEEFQKENEFEINKAINIAKNQKGPVHINVPFSEPLYDTVDRLLVDVLITSEEHINESMDDISEYLPVWEQAKKKLVLVGVLAPNSIEQELLDKLIEDESVVVFTETTSNLHHNESINSIDQLIAPFETSDFENLQPNLLLTFGGMVISKKVKSFLRNYPPKYHWHIDEKKAYDSYFVLSKHFKITPSVFLNDILSISKTSVNGLYKQSVLGLKEHRKKRHQVYLEQIPFSDFKVFSKIFENIPNQVQLQLSNSATVRYAQLFNLNASLHVFCNRGTSGIDGCTSTAIGAAVASNLPTVFITGDLSFLYDSNALWNQYIPKNFKIIVINNSGGGIFRILPGEKNTEKFDTYFETKHHLTAQHLCEMYGLNYNSASNVKDLEESISLFFQNNEQAQLLEVFTPNKVNDQVLLDYFKFIK